MEATREDGLSYPLLVGVVSWGVECGHEYYPGVYAKPNGDVAWMEKTICELSPDCTPSSPAPTPVPTEASPNNSLKITFTYDNTPDETQWDIILVGENAHESVIYTGPTYTPLANQTWSSTFDDFPSGDFKIVIRDENGLQPGAGFEVYLENAANPDGILVASGPESPFVGTSSTSFSVTQTISSPTPAPSPSTSTLLPTKQPTTPSSKTTAPPTPAPSESHTCVCLAGPLGCLAHLCHAQDNDQSECENFGCTWIVETNAGSTPPPNVEEPDDNDDDGSIEIEEEDSNLKKAGISAIVGVVAAVVTFFVLGICAAVWCNCGSRRRSESPLPSTRQPTYPTQDKIEIRRTSTASDDSEIGHGY